MTFFEVMWEKVGWETVIVLVYWSVIHREFQIKPLSTAFKLVEGLVEDCILNGNGDCCVDGIVWTRVLPGLLLELCFSASHWYLRR